jgi:predicted NUDIX family phosphoesterase
MNECVLVFPANLLDLPNGFDPNYRKYTNIIFNQAEPIFIDRSLAENDPGYKQIIPYQIIQNFDGSIFTYRRSSKGNENRLKKKLSLGIGGHINEDDKYNFCDDVNISDVESTYNAGRYREWKEEVKVTGAKPKEKIIGVIYDPSTDVGRVHFGIVHLYEISRENYVETIDPALSEPCWMTKGFLQKYYNEFELWSKFFIDTLLADNIK